MKHVIVIGGGVAGLTSAYYLTKNNFRVTLIEASPKYGGRTYSINDDLNADTYDNGQHIMMGCYKTFLKLISDLGVTDKLEIQKSLEINFADENGNITKLKAPKYFYPFNLAAAILKCKLFSLRDRLKILNFILDLICSADEDLKELTVIEWLMEKDQNEEAVKKLWEILAVGTMNATPEKGSAQIFDEVLREVFLTGSKSCRIVIPKVGLSELFVHPILEFLKSNDMVISNHEKLTNLIVENNRIIKLITTKTEYTSFDNVILAIPPHSIEKIRVENSHMEIIVPEFQVAIREFKYSPILNVHLWLNENPFKEKFYCLVESEIHWLFNHGKHISLTTSAADYLMGKETNEIIIEFCSELEKYFPIFKSKMVVAHKIIKEKRATFLPDCASNRIRKSISSPFENMLFAGDWTDTDLPATIEGAVSSGKLASDRVMIS